MAATTTQIGNLIQTALNESQKQAAHLLWNGFQSYLNENWSTVMLIIIAIFVILSLIAFTTGRWGSLGSLKFVYIHSLYSNNYLITRIRSAIILVSRLCLRYE